MAPGSETPTQQGSTAAGRFDVPRSGLVDLPSIQAAQSLTGEHQNGFFVGDEMDTEGYCKCGCGQKTKISAVSNKSKGWVKGKPIDYLRGHNFKDGKRGPLSPKWKGGRQISSHGYVVIWTPEGRKYEHIMVAERALGRALNNYGAGNPDTEVVHHVNGDKQDNRPENLLICTHNYHTELHHKLANSDAWPEFKKIERPGFGADRHVRNNG